MISPMRLANKLISSPQKFMMALRFKVPPSETERQRPSKFRRLLVSPGFPRRPSNIAMPTTF